MKKIEIKYFMFTYYTKSRTSVSWISSLLVRTENMKFLISLLEKQSKDKSGKYGCAAGQILA
jgi:hypothetical protein